MGAAVLLLSAVKDCNTAVHVLTIKNHCTTVCKKMQWEFTKLFSKTTGRNNISPPEKIPIIVSLFPIFEFSGLTTCKISRSIV